MVFDERLKFDFDRSLLFKTFERIVLSRPCKLFVFFLDEPKQILQSLAQKHFLDAGVNLRRQYKVQHLEMH